MRYIYKIANLLFFFFKTRKYNEEKKAPVFLGLTVTKCLHQRRNNNDHLRR